MTAPGRPWETAGEKKQAEKRAANQPSGAGIGCMLMGFFLFVGLAALFILAALIG